MSSFSLADSQSIQYTYGPKTLKNIFYESHKYCRARERCLHVGKVIKTFREPIKKTTLAFSHAFSIFTHCSDPNRLICLLGLMSLKFRSKMNLAQLL